MGSSSKTSTENKPPEWAEPLFKQSASSAQNLYNQGAGANTFLGSTVSPLSNLTMHGIGNLAQAGQNWDTSGTRPLFQGIGAASAGDPFVGQIQGVSEGVGGIASGQQGITTGDQWQDILNRAQNPTAASQFLTDTASGAHLTGEGNPFYRQRLEKEIEDANSILRSQMSGAGRYGSDVSNRLIGEQTQDMLFRGLESDWNRERGLQMQAVGMLDQANQGALASQMGAASGLTGVQGQNIVNQLAGSGLQGSLLTQAGNLRGQGLDRAMGAAGAMSDMDQRNFQNQLTGAGAQLQAGGMLDEQSQKLLNDEIAKFYALDNEDWTRLGLLQSAAAGAAGPYGTQLQHTRTSNPMAALGAIAPMFGGK